MASQLFSGKEQIFRDVLQLAQAWNTAIDQSGFEGGSMREIRDFQKTPAAKKIDEANQALSEYLEKLSFDDVKMVQVVMYLGRDRDYDKSLSSSEIYNDYFSFFNNQRWESKEIEIDKITEKAPLANYLRTGLEILNVII